MKTSSDFNFIDSQYTVTVVITKFSFYSSVETNRLKQNIIALLRLKYSTIFLNIMLSIASSVYKKWLKEVQ